MSDRSDTALGIAYLGGAAYFAGRAVSTVPAGWMLAYHLVAIVVMAVAGVALLAAASDEVEFPTRIRGVVS